MPIKISGAAFKAFYEDPSLWPNKRADEVAEGELYHAWHEEETVLVNGSEVEDFDGDHIRPEDVLTISGGVVWHDVRGASICKDHCSFETYVRRWLKKQSSDVLVVEVPKAKRDEIVAALKALGAKVL